MIDEESLIKVRNEIYGLEAKLNVEKEQKVFAYVNERIDIEELLTLILNNSKDITKRESYVSLLIDLKLGFVGYDDEYHKYYLQVERIQAFLNGIQFEKGRRR